MHYLFGLFAGDLVGEGDAGVGFGMVLLHGWSFCGNVIEY
jgi:hypothetical protein